MMNLNQFVPETQNRYMVNVYGDVIDVDLGKIISKPRSDRKVVEFDWFDGYREYEVGLVVVVSMMGVKIPSFLWGIIEPRYRDNDRLNTVPDNVYYSFKMPLKVPGKPDLFYIPFFTRYGISKSGELVDLEIDYVKKWTVTKPPKDNKKNIKHGYRVTRIYNDKGTGSNLSRHRAIALAFIPYPVHPHERIVNHLDGVPGNDSEDNLEWTTHSGNTQHAYDNGLQPNNVRAILVKNQAGEITRYDSIAACCKALKMTHSKLSHRLRNNPGKMYSDGVAVVYEDSEEWVDGLVKERETYAIAIKNVFTGDVMIVNNQREASVVTKVDDGTIWFHVSNESRTPIDGLLFRRYSDDEDIEWPVYSRWQLELFKRRPKKPPFAWVVTDTILETQELMFAEELSTHMGKSLSQAKAIANKGVSNCGRYRYELIKP